MKQGEGRIIVLIKDGKILTSKELGRMTIGVIAQIIVSLELLIEDLKLTYKKGVKKIEK